MRLQGQPLQILTALIRQPGQVVTRDEFQHQLWTGEYVRRFRSRAERGHEPASPDVLGDSADQPRYIETLPGRGYRFIAAVQDTAAEAGSGDGVHTC